MLLNDQSEFKAVFKLPQTRFLLLGVGVGYLCLMAWLRPRPVVVLSGGAIALTAAAIWVRQAQHFVPQKSENLLEREVFMEQLELVALDRQVLDAEQADWNVAYGWAESAHAAAAQLVQREPLLLPELIETLHTVIDLATHVVVAMQLVRQVQTLPYQELAQQRLQISRDRLHYTCTQLQQLCDQLALDDLDRRSQNTDSTLPTSLQILITDNKNALESGGTSS